MLLVLSEFHITFVEFKQTQSQNRKQLYINSTLGNATFAFKFRCICFNDSMPWSERMNYVNVIDLSTLFKQEQEPEKCLWRYVV